MSLLATGPSGGLSKSSALLLLCVFVFAHIEAAPTRVSVMTYNVENLFDTVDDPLTNDEAFLPLTSKTNPQHKQKCKQLNEGRAWECLFLDWNDARLDAKMKNLSKKILSVGAGKGPDILILAEIENRSVLELFNKKYLNSAYHVTHMDSHDKRGIDQAILSRLPRTEDKYQYHTIKLEKKNRKGQEQSKELRGILHAEYVVAGRKLHVMALHLPSQRAPFAERKILIEQLNRLALSVPANDVFIAGGDFNVSSAEWSKEAVYPSYFKDVWNVAHLEGCKKCLGTYYYKPKKEWSFFDLFLLRFDREKKPRWSWDAASVKLVNPENKVYPEKFDPNRLIGDSDHFPLYAELVID